VTESELEEFDAFEDLLCDSKEELTDEQWYRYFELLAWKRQEELGDELFDASILIANGAVDPDVFNSYEWVNNCVEQLKDYTHPTLFVDVYLPLDTEWKTLPRDSGGLHLIDDYWRGVETLEYFQQHLSKEAWDATEDDPLYIKTPIYPTPVERLIADIRCGSMPAPELLLSLAKAFDLYLTSGGGLTLEEVFFGRHKANDIRANRRRSSYKGISLQEFDFCVRRSGETLEELALSFIQGHMSEYPESKIIPENAPALLKKYHRWKTIEGLAKTKGKD
tara:strand:+ start:1479 stop:2312 length:834 start_codon:yes stop_codon:yes gene_type:complete